MIFKNTAHFYIEFIYTVVSLQLYMKSFYYKIELMYKIRLSATIKVLVLVKK